MDGRHVAARWLIAQCEPLVPTLDRAVAEDGFVALTVSNADWVAGWFTGVITDHMLTLPPADPWRSLSARVGSSMTRGRVPQAPSSTGAVGANGPFGTLADGQDIVRALFSDASTDIGLAAISSGISAGGGALLAFACDGWEVASRAARLLHVEHLSETGGDRTASAGRFFADLSGAFRWAAWRRRAYLGPDDWTVVSGVAWLWRADEIAAHGRLPEQEWADLRHAVEAERIDPAAYAAIVGHV
jgi:hypothetical protein